MFAKINRRERRDKVVVDLFMGVQISKWQHKAREEHQEQREPYTQVLDPKHIELLWKVVKAQEAETKSHPLNSGCQKPLVNKQEEVQFLL